jgi:cbb3-type cytochrome oxidase subunit 3
VSDFNISNALLILGTIWLYGQGYIGDIVTALLVIFGIGSWSYHAFGDERREIFKQEANLYKAKAKYYRAMSKGKVK